MKPDILIFKALFPSLLEKKKDPSIKERYGKKIVPITLFGERDFGEDPQDLGQRYDFIFWAVLGLYAFRPEEPESVASLRVPIFPYMSNDAAERLLKVLNREYKSIDTIALETPTHELDFHRLIKRESSSYLARKRLEIKYVGGSFDESIGPKEILRRSGFSQDILYKIEQIEKIYGKETPETSKDPAIRL